MKIKRLFYLLVICFLCYNSQTAMAQTMTTSEKIEQVYGSYYPSLLPAYIDWFTDCIDRCEVVTMSGSSLEDLPLLSSIPLLLKYNDSLTIDYTYDATTFNPFKYMINFHKDVDQYFRIGSTNQVLKVAKED